MIAMTGIRLATAEQAPGAADSLVATARARPAARQKNRAGAAISKRGWPSCSPDAPPGPMPTMRCRSTAATVTRSNSGQPGASAQVLLDARILNIFEGAAEIQAQIVGRGLVSDGN